MAIWMKPKTLWSGLLYCKTHSGSFALYSVLLATTGVVPQGSSINMTLIKSKMEETKAPYQGTKGLKELLHLLDRRKVAQRYWYSSQTSVKGTPKVLAVNINTRAPLLESMIQYSGHHWPQMNQIQMIYRLQLKKTVLHSVSLDANSGHLFSMCLAGQKATSGFEKAKTKEGVLSAKGLDGAAYLLFLPAGLWTSAISCWPFPIMGSKYQV